MVLPLTWTVNCEAPMTVARMRWPGSINGRAGRPPRAPATRPPRPGGRERFCDIAEFFVLMAENVFGNAAGERQRGRHRHARQRLGQQQRLTEWVESSAADHIGRDHGEALR